MKSNQTLTRNVLQTLYQAPSTRMTLDDLCEVLGLNDVPAREGVRLRRPRREDVREIVRRLDEEGFVDALRMRLTLRGFTLAAALAPGRRMPLSLAS